MSDNVNLKTIIADEYKRCAKDPIYFFKKYVYIQHPTLGKIKFNLYKFQEMVLKELFDYDYNIILKSRQLGISTVSAAIALHLMIFNKDKNVLVIATKQEVAKNMVSKVRYAYDNLPSWLKEGYIENNKLNLKLKNGSQIKATSSSGDAGRSEAVSMLVVDEAAFIPEIEEIWGSAQQTLATGGRAIVLSCVVRHSYIFTSKGIKTISDFIPNNGMPGDYTIPEYDIFGKDCIRSGNLFHNNGKVKTKIIKTKFSELEGSYNHKVLAYRQDTLQYKWPTELSELKVGDYIAIRKNMNLFGNNDILDVKYSTSNKIKNPIHISKIDEDLSYLFGLYISEGNANYIYNSNQNIVGGNLNITCGDDISWVFDKLNLNYYCQDNLHYSVSNKNLIEIFASLGFNLSDRANNKKIPTKLLEMSKNNIIQLLRGIFDGDGCVSKKAISYSSASKTLINQIRMLLLNFGILSHVFVRSKEKMNEYSVKNKSGFKYNYDSYVIEIYGKNALRFYNQIGFNLHRKKKLLNNLKMCKFNRSSAHDVIPDSLQLMKKLYDVSGETAWSLNKKYKININGILNKTKKYPTNNISRENVIKMFNLFSHLLPMDTFNEWNEYIDDDIVWVPITNILESEAETFDFSLPNNVSDMWAHSVLYNGIIGHQTPNGVANWYHKEWVKAKEGKNKFHTIQLHWSMHPERDQAWRDEQDLILGERMAAQECFDGNTRIYTDGGFKKISDISIGDMVLTHRGKFKKVLRTYSHIDDNLLQIHSYNNKNIRYVTKNHPFLTNSNEWTELKNINSEDILKSFPIQIENTWLNDTPILDLYNNFIPKNFKKILKSDDTFYVNDRKHKTIHNRYISIDYDLGYLIGLYLAKGSKSRLRTVFSFDYNKEKDGWPIRLQKIIEEKFGLTKYTMRYKGSNTCDFEISSEVLSNFIDLFVDGNRCYNKKLTERTYDYNTKQFYSGILDGVFRGDGCLTNTVNKKISITSLDLIYDIKYISSLLGYNLSSIQIIDKEYKMNYNKKTRWSDKNYNCHDTYVLSFYVTKNCIVESEFTGNCLCPNVGYSYKNSIFKTESSIDCKIYIDDCDEILPVYNIEVEDDNSYVTEHFIVHNCDADFLASGNTVINVDTLKFYKETFIKPPIETRGPNKELWVWESPNYRKTYLVCADVARGDGSDYSTAHVLDVEAMTQVAEFKAQLSTKDFGNFLVGLASEYNDALLVIENSTIGWAAIQQIIERNYSNLFYTEQALKYVDVTKPKQGNKLNAIEKKSVPGFTTSPTSRPLMINKLEEYFRTRDFMLYSDRTMNELYAFIWNGQKAEAMKGYNDDLVMALAIGLWVRDTALQLNKLKLQGTKANLDTFTVVRPDASFYGGAYTPAHDQWNIPIGHPGEEEDISKWLL